MTVTVQKLYSAFVAAPLDGIRQPDFEQLNTEIDADVGIPNVVEPKSRPFDLSVPNVGIEFAIALSGSENTALDALIAAHTGLGIVRGNDTHTFLFSGVPGVNDDGTVIGAGDIAKYEIGDFGLDTTSGPPNDLYVVDDLTTGAARWTKQNVATGAAQVPSLALVATMDAIAVSTTPGPIQYDDADLTKIDGFFSYSSPTLTCLKACRVAIWVRLDSSVNAGSSRSGIRLDIRVNDVSRVLTSNNADSSGGNAVDTQNNSFDQVELAINDTVKFNCNSYVTGLSDVFGVTNRVQIVVTEDLT